MNHRRTPTPRDEAAVAALEVATRDLAVAQAEFNTAAHRVEEAQGRVADAKARTVEDHHLSALALSTNNRVARERLAEQIKAMHPAFLGYAPVPAEDVGDGEWFKAPMSDLCVLFGFTSAEATDEFIASLAVALRDFVRRFRPQINGPKAIREGYARALCSAGVLFYHLSPARDAVVLTGAGDGDTGGAANETRYATLEEALGALPSEIFLSALSGQVPYEMRNALSS